MELGLRLYLISLDTQQFPKQNMLSHLLCCSGDIVGKICFARSKSPRIISVLYSIKLRSKVYPMTLHTKEILTH